MNADLETETEILVQQLLAGPARGLRNADPPWTCFANVVLQLLSRCASLLRHSLPHYLKHWQ
jgi:hypothetical protein